MGHDLWYALRRLRARPWNTGVLIAIMALGTGAALTVLRVADAVLLHGLPYRAADRLVRVTAIVPMLPTTELPFSDVGYRALEKRTRGFDGVASYRVVGVNMIIGSNPRRVLSARVTGNFFDLLGLPPQRGRLFEPGAEAAHGPPVVVLSDALWRSAFGGDPAVVGTTVRLDGLPATIIGIADPRVAFPSADVGYFTLMDLDPLGTSPFELGIDVVGRMRPGVTVHSITDEATAVMRAVARENPGPHSTPTSDVSGFHAVVRPLRDDMAGGVRPTLVLLTVAVFCVLLLTCVNVATLELARSSGRRAELAVRAALGASRRRIIAGGLIEGAVQATAGVALGLGASALAVRALASLLPTAFGAGIDGRITLGVAVGATCMVALGAAAAGVFPVAATLGSDLQSALRNRDAATTRRLRWLRQGMIIAQLAFAVVLVHSAALMIVTVRDAQRVALGFRPDGLEVFELSLPRETYGRLADVTTMFSAVTDRLRALPGVTQVGLTNTIPLDADYASTMLAVEGRPFKADGTDPNVDYRIISAGYFAAMGIPLLDGRGFIEGDPYLDGTPVVISRSLARLLWPDGTEPVGHRLRTGPYAPWLQIIGVVDDAKNRSVTAAARPEMYLPFGAPRSPMGVTRDMFILVRANTGAAGLPAAAQAAMRRDFAELPLYGIRAYTDVVARSEMREVTTMRTLTTFAIVALMLAIAGSYAMLMFVVGQRRRELALRQAVGATGDDLARMIAREMGTLLLAGSGAGMAAVLLASRLLANFLFGVSALDVRTVLATLAIVFVAGLGAALVPARRAARVDLMSLLRME